MERMIPARESETLISNTGRVSFIYIARNHDTFHIEQVKTGRDNIPRWKTIGNHQEQTPWQLLQNQEREHLFIHSVLPNVNSFNYTT